MAIPSRTVLVAELHCLSEDGLVVITAQRWSDRSAPAERPRTWLRLVRNGRPCDDRRFTGARSHREVEIIWGQLAERYAPTGLAEDQMWVKLQELTGVGQARCSGKDCTGRMPVGWQICPECDRSAGRVASGSLSGVRGRASLLLDLRRPDTR